MGLLSSLPRSIRATAPQQIVARTRSVTRIRYLNTEFVIVGGGSSGAALAGRLAEAGRDVVLLEAGPDYGAHGDPAWPTELVDARALATTHYWGYRADRWVFERARVIGGWLITQRSDRGCGAPG